MFDLRLPISENWLGNRLKRKVLYNYFRDKSLDIVFMQETHSTKQKVKMWKNEWGGDWVNSSYSSQSRGVAILVNPKCKAKITLTKTDHEGRIVLANLEMLDTEDTITLCNIYAPNEDDPKFFARAFKMVHKHAVENIVIGGDFNLTLCPEMDRYKSMINNSRSTQYIQAYMDENQMNDVWRDQYPNSRRYTWLRKHKSELSASRLDFFLLNTGLTNSVVEQEISASTHTDHALVTIKLRSEDIKRGPGIWKFNNLLLTDEKFCTEMSQQI